MPTTRSGKQYGANDVSTTRSGKRYGVEAVEPPKAPKTRAEDPKGFEHKFVLRISGLTSDEAILSSTASDLKPKPNKTNYLFGTHHFIFTLTPDDAFSFGFEKLELVFRVYHGFMPNSPTNSIAVKDFIVHRGSAQGLVMTDPDSSFWRNSEKDFEFALYESQTFANSVATQMIAPKSSVLKVFLEVLKVAQEDMERIVAKVIRRKVKVFKLDDNIAKTFQQ